MLNYISTFYAPNQHQFHHGPRYSTNTAGITTERQGKRYASKVDLRKLMNNHPIPKILPGLVDPAIMAGDAAMQQVRSVLNQLNNALATDNFEKLRGCFFPSQTYWKDQLALTYHLRTFSTPGIVAASLLETKAMRNVVGEIVADGEAQFIPVMPTLQFIDCGIAFRTSTPAATCGGKLMLLPVEGNDGAIQWKIWILSTTLENLDLQHENEELLQSPARHLDWKNDIQTDVFIVGGGNAAVALAMRLKALGVESIMAERKAQPGDNWALRYDYMRFHLPTSFCDLPYLPYDEALRGSHLLTKDELASQVKKCVETFNLNMVTSAQIQSTQYDSLAMRWTTNFKTPGGPCTAVAKHLVLATGIGSQRSNIPRIADSHLYQGISFHSTWYKNAKELSAKGARSALVVGSANTAFDVMEDCHAAGLQTTMVARSPTYIMPAEYLTHKMVLGAYEMDTAIADRLFLSLPSQVDGQLSRGMLASLAEQEPNRYADLAAAGFPVVDSRHPQSALIHNLLERGGGHYVDVGGTKLLEEGKVGVKAGVEPVAYTPNGLRFSDGTCIDADAIVWCTGFSDLNISSHAAQILGGSPPDENANGQKSRLMGPSDIAACLDPTWGVDSEGEIRGMWKRHSHLDDNFWIMGGYTQQHRWHSRTLALQIKAALEGILPPAYLHTPL